MNNSSLSYDKAPQLNQIFKKSASALLIIVIGYAAEYVANNLLARYLGAAIYGDLAVILRVSMFSMSFLLIGMDDTATIFLPKYISAKKWDMGSGFLRRSFTIFLFTSLLLITIGSLIIIFILMLHFMNIKNILEHHPIIFSLWLFPLVALLFWQAKLLNTVQKIATSLFTIRIVRFVLFVLGILLIVTFFKTINIYQALLVWGLIIVTLIFVQFILIWRFTPHKLFTTPPHYTMGKLWFTKSLKFMSANMGYRAFEPLTIVILEMLGFKEYNVGIYAAILTITGICALVTTVGDAIIKPFASTLVKRRNIRDTQTFAVNCNIIMLIAAILIFVAIILFGKQILVLFGKDFVQGYIPLLMILCGGIINILSNTSYTLLAYSEYQSAIAKINLVTLIIMIIIGTITTPKYDIYGIAWAYLITSIISGIFLYIFTKKKLKIKQFLLF